MWPPRSAMLVSLLPLFVLNDSLISTSTSVSLLSISTPWTSSPAATLPPVATTLSSPKIALTSPPAQTAFSISTSTSVWL